MRRVAPVLILLPLCASCTLFWATTDSSLLSVTEFDSTASYSASLPTVRMAAIGSSLLAAAGTAGLVIFDVSDPTLPRQVGHLAVAEGDEASSIALDGDIAYLATESGEVILVDISDAGHPVELSRLPAAAPSGTLEVTGYAVRSLEAGGGLALVGALCSGTQEPDLILTDTPMLTVWDCTLPASPSLRMTWEKPPSTVLSWDGRYLFAPAKTGDMEVWDLLDPAAPVAVASVATGVAESWRITRIALSGPLAVVTTLDHTVLVDASYPVDAHAIGVFAVALSSSFRVRESLLYDSDATWASGAIRAWDVSSPLRPADVGYHSGSFTDMLPVADLLYALNGGTVECLSIPLR